MSCVIAVLSPTLCSGSYDGHSGASTRRIVAVAVTVPIVIFVVIFVVLVIVVCRRHRARRTSATPVTYSGPTQQPTVHVSVRTNGPGLPQVYAPPKPPSTVVAEGEPFGALPSYTIATSNPHLFPSAGCGNIYPESGCSYPYGLPAGGVNPPAQLTDASPMQPLPGSSNQQPAVESLT